ncbi:MAG: heat-inducible transcription repressor HrcA [Chloroflexi bacterium]|nr:heat-inducible transcription repressor HrcA [Chloroflexota bacterium]
MLTQRQEAILNLIVGEYVASATPVPSQSIAKRHGRKMSPATVRFEMAELEGEGYIHRRHVSSGGVPSDKGYRLHVETLPAEPDIPARETQHVQRLFMKSADSLEEWTRRAAELLGDMAQNMAVVSVPKAPQTKMKRLELVHLQDFLALLVLIFQGAKTKQRILHLPEAASQDDLNALSNKFSAAYGGATYAGMIGQDTTLPATERLVLEATREILQNEEQAPIGETFSSGLRHFLAQPEFSDSSRARALLDAVEEQDFILDAISGKLADDGVRVMIGEENGREEIDDCSVIISRYGWPDRAGGFIAVLGPTRMKYDRSMAAARLMAQLMTSLAEDLG